MTSKRPRPFYGWLIVFVSAVGLFLGARKLDLKTVSTTWSGAGQVEMNRYFIRCRLNDPAGLTLTAFEDGRVIVQGTKDLSRARSVVARFIGT